MNWRVCCICVGSGLAQSSVRQGNILGICSNSWMCVCIRSTGYRCMPSLTHRSTQTTSARFASQDRIHPALPSRCQSRQPSFDSLTFQFYPPALSPSVSFLSSPPHLSLSPFISCTHPLIFYPSWRAIPETSIIAFCYIAEDGIEFDAPTRLLRDVRRTQIRSACRPVAGRSSTLQHRGPNLIHLLLSLSCSLSVPSFTSCPPLFVIVSPASAPFVSPRLAHCHLHFPSLSLL